MTFEQYLKENKSNLDAMAKDIKAAIEKSLGKVPDKISFDHITNALEEENPELLKKYMSLGQNDKFQLFDILN